MIKIEQLALEITRRCNLKCAHCMRGTAEKTSMPKIIILKSLDIFSRIDRLVLAGGEPTLAIVQLQVILEELKRGNTQVDHFYITTNGKKFSSEALTLITEIYKLAKTPSNNLIRVSADQFHNRGASEEVARLLQDTKELVAEVFLDMHIEESTILPMGRGLDFENFGIMVEREKHVISIDDSGLVLYGADELYINAYGDILNNCDISYEEQNICSNYGNVMRIAYYTEDFIKFISNFKTK